MKKLILAISMLLFILNVQSQTADSTITIINKRYYQNGQELNYSDLKTILSNNPVSKSEFELFKKNKTPASTLLAAGSICILAAGITSMSSSMKQSNDQYSNDYSTGIGFAIVGLSCAVISIPLSISSRNHFNKAVDLYNSNISDIKRTPCKMELSIVNNGMALRLIF